MTQTKFLLGIVILFGALTTIPMASADRGEDQITQEKTEQVEIVRRGDTLADISFRVYGTHRKWQAIFLFNKSKIGNPNRILAGMKVFIPLPGYKSRSVAEEAFGPMALARKPKASRKLSVNSQPTPDRSIASEMPKSKVKKQLTKNTQKPTPIETVKEVYDAFDSTVWSPSDAPQSPTSVAQLETTNHRQPAKTLMPFTEMEVP